MLGHDVAIGDVGAVDVDVGVEAALSAATSPPSVPSSLTADAARSPSFYLVLTVVARGERAILGPHIERACREQGMTLGHDGVFHALVAGSGGVFPRESGTGASVFSAANLLHPGTFDAERLAELETRGLCFFLALPGPRAGVAAFDAMLGCARRVAEQIEADLCDERRCILTRQAEQAMRESVVEFVARQRELRVGAEALAPRTLH